MDMDQANEKHSYTPNGRDIAIGCSVAAVVYYLIVFYIYASGSRSRIIYGPEDRPSLIDKLGASLFIAIMLPCMLAWMILSPVAELVLTILRFVLTMVKSFLSTMFYSSPDYYLYHLARPVRQLFSRSSAKADIEGNENIDGLGAVKIEMEPPVGNKLSVHEP